MAIGRCLVLSRRLKSRRGAAARKKLEVGIFRSGGLLGGSRPGYFVAAAFLRAAAARDTSSYAVAKNEPD